jgi:hypothetical protein
MGVDRIRSVAREPVTGGTFVHDLSRKTRKEVAMQAPKQSQTTKRRFRIDKLEERIAPTITQVNGGGNTPNGNANGIPATNPAGHAPPGQNP